MTRNAPVGPDDSSAEWVVFDVTPSILGFPGEVLLGVLLLIVLIGLFILLRVVVRAFSLRYRLTTERLFIQRGLIARHVDEVELFRIKDVAYDQGILQRLTGTGTVTVLSTDDTTPQVRLVGVREPDRLKEALRKHVRAIRKRERMHAAELIAS